MSEPLLSIEDLSVSVRIAGVPFRALDGVSLTVERGEARGIVGESGSGKSLTLRAITGLLPGGATVDSGTIRFDGSDLLADGGLQQRRVRGSGISMIFQEPAVALNPIMRVGDQISDSLRQHRGLSSKQARARAIELMDLVGIPDPATRLRAYPFQLSGGLRQRVMIAAAVACGPKLILCDEPTTALDVRLQAQILGLFAHLRDELGASLLWVTHDLAVVAQLCDSLTVLYAGRVMETSRDMDSILRSPRHPYSEALLKATPRLEGPVQRLTAIPGGAPSLTDPKQGCPFSPRCAYARPECTEAPVPLRPVGEDWSSACLFPLDTGAAAVRSGT